MGDGRFFDFDAVEPVLESTWLGFLVEKTENKADVHPMVAGGVEGLLFWLLGVEDMVNRDLWMFVPLKDLCRGDKRRQGNPISQTTVEGEVVLAKKLA